MKLQDPDDEKFFELLSKVQSKRLDDQRGLSDRFEMPDFLKEFDGETAQRSVSTSNMLEAVSIVCHHRPGLSKSMSQPEGLDHSTPSRRGGTISDLTPDRNDIEFADMSFSQEFIMPSHNQAEDFFSNGLGRGCSPDFNYHDPKLMKRSIRDLGFNYSFQDDGSPNQTPNSRLMTQHNFDPLSPRAMLPKSAESSPLNDTLVDCHSRSNSLDNLDRTITEDTKSTSQTPPPPLVEVPKTKHVGGDSSIARHKPTSVSPCVVECQVIPEPRRSPYARRSPRQEVETESETSRKPPLVPEKPKHWKVPLRDAGVNGNMYIDVNSEERQCLPDLPSPSTHELITDTSIQKVNVSLNDPETKQDVKVTFV